jgi:hypothetical protein
MNKPFNKPFKEGGTKRIKVMWERVEAEKHMALWTGIFFFMTLIIFLWVVNTRDLFEYYQVKKKGNFGIMDLSTEFNQAWGKFKESTIDMNVQGVKEEIRKQ